MILFALYFSLLSCQDPVEIRMMGVKSVTYCPSTDKVYIEGWRKPGSYLREIVGEPDNHNPIFILL